MGVLLPLGRVLLGLPLSGIVAELLGRVDELLGIVEVPLGMVVEPLGVAPMEPVPLWLGKVGFGVVSGVGEVFWLGVAGVADAAVADGVVVCA